MVNAERLRNSYVENTGAIDRFGTVVVAYHAQPGRRRKDHRVRVYHPLLHKYADGMHRAVLEGAVLRILDRRGAVVVTISPRQMEAAGRQLDLEVTQDGFLIDPKCETGAVTEALGEAAAGLVPSHMEETAFARVSPKYAKQSMVVFWLDDDNPVVFTSEGGRIPCAVEYPLSRKKRLH